MTEIIKIGKHTVEATLVRRGEGAWSLLFERSAKGQPMVLGHLWQRDPSFADQELLDFGLQAEGEWGGATATKPPTYNTGSRAAVLRWLAAPMLQEKLRLLQLLVRHDRCTPRNPDMADMETQLPVTLPKSIVQALATEGILDRADLQLLRECCKKALAQHDEYRAGKER